MQGFPNKQTIERLRKMYPRGTRVELVSMNDPYAKLIPERKEPCSSLTISEDLCQLGLWLRSWRRLWRGYYPQNLGLYPLTRQPHCGLAIL